MSRFSIKCGDLKTVIVAKTAYKACVESLDFVKDGMSLGTKFIVNEVHNVGGSIKLNELIISYDADSILKKAGWV